MTIGPGDSFILNTNYAGTCYNSTLTASPSSGSGLSSEAECQNKYTITPSSKGTYEYTYSVTNGSIGTVSCENSVTVDDIPPKITCPDDKTVKVGSTVSVKPKSLVGCGDGCSYTIGTVATAASGYTGGSISFNGSSVEGDVTYNFEVTNSDGSDDCDFTVTYSKSADSEVSLTVAEEGKTVECGKTINVSIEQAQYNSTVLVCSGDPSGKVGEYDKPANNQVSITVCDKYENGTPITCTGTYATECTGSLTCALYRW